MKKFICGLITILLVLVICLLAVGLKLKIVCVNTINDSIVKKEISSKALDSISSVLPNIDYDTLQEVELSIQNDESTKRITEKYYDEIINSIVNNTDIDVPDTSDEIKKIIDDNKDVLKKHGVELTDTQEDEIANSLAKNGTINTVYKKVTTNLKNNLTDDQKEAIGMYSTITSKEFRNTLIIISIIFILLIALIKKSIYKWMINLSVALILSGILLSFVLEQVVNNLSSTITNKLFGKATSINVNPITAFGYKYLLIGIIFLLIYIVINILTNKKRKQS